MYEELIARLEAATEGSRALDFEVALAVGWTTRIHKPQTNYDMEWTEWVPPPGVIPEVQSVVDRYTRSLDAALTLVPEGWWLQHLGHNLAGWGARIETQGISIPNSTNIPRSKTPALALCIAALKARQAAPPTVAGGLNEAPNTDES